MNMFSNMSTQVSGLGTSLGSWFKKEGGKEEGAEGQEGQEGKKEQTSPQEQHSPASANASEQSVKGSADENEDAASQHSGSVAFALLLSSPSISSCGFSSRFSLLCFPLFFTYMYSFHFPVYPTFLPLIPPICVF